MELYKHLMFENLTIYTQEEKTERGGRKKARGERGRAGCLPPSPAALGADGPLSIP